MFDVEHIGQGVLQQTTRQILLWRNEPSHNKELGYVSRQECDPRGTLSGEISLHDRHGNIKQRYDPHVLVR